MWLLTLAVSALAADNLTLAPGLSFTDDSSDDFPIRGDHLTAAEVVEGRAAVVFFGASNCWNTTREAERLVTLYPKFRDRVSFIIVDVNHPSVMSGVWWKSERKASSSGAVGLQLCPLGSGCRRMTPWEAIAGSGDREKGARSVRTPSSA